MIKNNFLPIHCVTSKTMGTFLRKQTGRRRATRNLPPLPTEDELPQPAAAKGHRNKSLKLLEVRPPPLMNLTGSEAGRAYENSPFRPKRDEERCIRAQFRAGHWCVLQGRPLVRPQHEIAVFQSTIQPAKKPSAAKRSEGPIKS